MARIGAFYRLVRAAFVLTREGVVTAAAPPDPPPLGEFVLRIARLIEHRRSRGRSRAEQLTRALNRLGPSYVKLGQFLATRPDIVGQEMADGLGLLRDEIPPFETKFARATIETTLEQEVGALFSRFSEPIAAASVAQVHRAIIDDESGERVVAVKVLRPGVRVRFQRDLESFYLAADLALRFARGSERLRPRSVVDTLARSAVMEMDLRLEAAALSEMSELAKDQPDFDVPSIDWTRTGRSVLTIDWIDGIKLSDRDGLIAAGHDVKKLAVSVIQTFLSHAIENGFFHADMHEGNLFVDHDGVLVAIDFGITGRIGPAERRFLAEILYGFITRNYRRIAEVHFEAGYVPPIHQVEDFAQALRAIGEPIHGQSARQISMARLLSLLFEITDLFDMSTRPELLMLQKTMVVVEGVARKLDPDFDMWSAAEPVVSVWIQRYLGPAGQIERLGDLSRAVGRLAIAAPKLAEEMESLTENLGSMGREGLRFDQKTADAIGRAEARHSKGQRIALWIIAAASVVAALSLWQD